MEPLPWYRLLVPVAACLLFVVVAWRSRIERFRFAAAGMIALTSYGMLQDQISVRLCPEYFTILHPPIPGLVEPTLLGVAWGFLGSWWGGFLLGYGAGIAATYGPAPSFPLRQFVRPLALLLLVIATAAAVTGWNVAHHAELLDVRLGGDLVGALPPERHRAALVVACYHFAAYLSAILGGVVLCIWIARQRRTQVTRDS